MRTLSSIVYIRNIKILFFVCLIACLVFSCASSKSSFDPQKKYPISELKTDYKIFRGILETAHPSIYWYTSKDSMDYYFDQGYKAITDSMTESKFREHLSSVISKLNCGHTTMKGSKKFSKYLDTAKGKAFPFAMKFWADTMVITANLRRNDPLMQRGTIVKSINGLDAHALTDSFFKYITTDGYSETGKYQTLSTGFTFANLYKNTIGITDSFDIRYLDSTGSERRNYVQSYDFRTDTLYKSAHRGPADKDSKKREKYFFNYSSTNLQVDTVYKTAFMTLSTFERSHHLKRFIKNSFKNLKKEQIRYLIIDVRSNGGGDAGLSTLITRYIIDHKFKLADSLYTIKPSGDYKKYIHNNFLYSMVLTFMTKKDSNNKYHFRYFEKHYYDPKVNNHFDGKVYILIGGNSFSATTLFAGDLKGQKNVTLVGEETGGGYYGNTAWIIPDVTLPNTGLRFRLPRFRMVIDKTREKNGHGVMPDVWSGPTSDAIRNNIDFKVMKVKELIEQQAIVGHTTENH